MRSKIIKARIKLSWLLCWDKPNQIGTSPYSSNAPHLGPLTNAQSKCMVIGYEHACSTLLFIPFIVTIITVIQLNRVLFMCHGVCADVVFAVWVPLFQYDDCHLLLDKFFVESEWMSEFLENVIYVFVSIVHNLWFDDLWWCCSFYVITLLWFVPKCHWVWVFDDFIRCSLFCFVLFESFDKHTMDKISAAIAMNNCV